MVYCPPKLIRVAWRSMSGCLRVQFLRYLGSPPPPRARPMFQVLLDTRASCRKYSGCLQKICILVFVPFSCQKKKKSNSGRKILTKFSNRTLFYQTSFFSELLRRMDSGVWRIMWFLCVCVCEYSANETKMVTSLWNKQAFTGRESSPLSGYKQWFLTHCISIALCPWGDPGLVGVTKLKERAQELQGLDSLCDEAGHAPGFLEKITKELCW